MLAKLEEEQRHEAFICYVTDCLQMIVNNTACYGGGTVINKRFAELVNEKQETDTRTAEEITADVIKKAGLVVIND